MRRVQNIVDKELCIGCGLCEAVFGSDVAQMEEGRSGFFTPVFRHKERVEEDVILRICPGVNIVNDQPFDRGENIWGKLLEAYSGYSKQKDIRYSASSGGVISGVAVYMLENKLVDAVLQVGGDSKDYKRNSLRVSRSRADVLACSSSRYAPSLVFDKVLKILNDSTDRFLFIGKPCDVSGIKNLIKEFPEYENRFVLFVALFCAGIPSFSATQEVIETFPEVKYPIRDLMYRGEGWPGKFSFVDHAGSYFSMSYNESWGDKLGKKLHFRCKICPDGIGLQADVAVGDAWETVDGYPDFSDKEGQSLVLLRTLKATKLFMQMQLEKQLKLSLLSLQNVRQMQPFQYSRRRVAGVRMLATIVGKRVFLNFRGLRLGTSIMRLPFFKGVREFFGTLKRIMLK